MGAAMANETLGSLKNLPTNMKHTLFLQTCRNVLDVEVI